MSSRDRILSQIRQNKPEEVALPRVTTFVSHFENTEDKFREMLGLIYTEVIVVKNLEELATKAEELYSGVVNRATTIPALSTWANFSLNVSDPHELETVEIAIVQAEFGVAENGAVWVSDQYLPHRVLPFITQNLAFVIPRNALVDNMHEAYVRLQDTSGWGCFIAGPSKTADIEQSLVIGAHGARSMVIFLLEGE